MPAEASPTIGSPAGEKLSAAPSGLRRTIAFTAVAVPDICTTSNPRKRKAVESPEADSVSLDCEYGGSCLLVSIAKVSIVMRSP